MQNCISIGISMPKEILSKIDLERGDIPRSKYVIRLLEVKYVDAGTINDKKLRKQDSPKGGLEGQISSEIRSP